MSSRRSAMHCLLCLALATLGAFLPAERVVYAAEASRDLPQASDDVRRTMDALRMLVVTHHTLVTHRRLSVVAGRKFAGDVGMAAAQLERDLQSLKIPAMQAMAQDVRKASTLLSEPPSSSNVLDGLMLLVGVLEAYPRIVSHPGWKPLQQLND